MSGSNNKFLFDLNKFDEPDEPEIEEVEIIEDLPPPPPTFSEEELAAAKAAAHMQGKSEGIQEERAKREQELSDYMGKISESFGDILAKEMYREKQYEQESVKLALELLTHLSPILEEKLGRVILRDCVQKAVLAQSKQTEITIEVAKDFVQEIEQMVHRLFDEGDQKPKIRVKAGKDAKGAEMSHGACHITWKDGGMVRDPIKTAASIKENLEALLVDSDNSFELEDIAALPPEFERVKEAVPAPQKDDIITNITDSLLPQSGDDDQTPDNN